MNPDSSAGSATSVQRQGGIRPGRWLANVMNGATTMWQPIETAPKDGTEIIVYDGTQVTAAMYCESYGGGWFDRYGAWEDAWEGNKIRATHWMHLPPPPTA